MRVILSWICTYPHAKANLSKGRGAKLQGLRAGSRLWQPVTDIKLHNYIWV